MRTVKIFVSALIILLLIFNLSRSYNLREIGAIDRRENEIFYGLKTGDIISLRGNDLTFYNRRFETVYELPIDPASRVVVSSNGRHYAVIEPGDSSGAPCFTVYDNRRQSLWGGIPTVSGEYFLSPDGCCLAVVTGRTGYYDRRVVWYHKDIPPQGHDILNFESILFSDDGRKIMFDAGLKGVYLFGINGRLIKNLEPRKYLCFGRSSDYIGTYSRGLIEIYRDSSLIWSYNIGKPLVYGFSLCEDTNRFVIAFSKSIQSIDMKKNRVLWQDFTNIKGGRFTSAEVSSDRRFIACGVDVNRGTSVEKTQRHIQGFLYLCDFEGRSTEKMEFRYSSYAEGVPRVHFQPNNRIIAVETEEKVHFIEIY